MSATVEGSRAIVTGGAQGIGFQLCRHLLINRAKSVAIFDIDERIGQESMKKLNDEFGQGRCLFFATDVTKFDQLEGNFKKAIQKLGGLEILINNAGILDSKQWSSMIDVNIKSVVHGTLLGINYMGKHKGGRGGTIINTGSTTAFYKEFFAPIYAATKSAVISFSRLIGKYYEKTGVAVKTMCPGLVETNMVDTTPHRLLDFIDKEEVIELYKIQPTLKPEDIAEEVMRLIKDPSSNAVWVKKAGLPPSRVNIVDLPDKLIPLDLKDQ